VGVVLALVLSSTPASATVGQTVRSVANGKCLDIRDGGASDLVQVWACGNGGVGARHQDWNYVHHPELGSTVYEIKSRLPGRTNHCVSGAGGPNAQVFMDVCGTTVAQYWWAENFSNGHRWKTYNTWDNKHYCMDVKDNGTSSVVWLYTCLNQNNQKWNVV
jgi:hypothetical protein